MKKNTIIILLIIAVIVLGVIAYLVFGATKSNEIELTLDNYDDYLKINIQLNHPKDTKLKTSKFEGANGSIYPDGQFSSYLALDVKVEGVSSNFLYSDIVLVVRANGKHLVCDSKQEINGLDWYYKTSWQTIAFTHKVKCNLDITGTGKGIDEDKYSISNKVFPTAFAAGGFVFDYEIVSIQGKVTPVDK